MRGIDNNKTFPHGSLKNNLQIGKHLHLNKALGIIHVDCMQYSTV